ncbi:MAG: Holliday junction resolvase RuvX [Opitutae bacterium]|nr:Holliday junction resolvase RuvX [Opitutae bacterium]
MPEQQHRRFLAIDYGSRRIGLAHGDDELGIALPAPAAVEAGEAERMEHIAAEIRARRINVLVVGFPVNMDGSHGYKTREVDAFIGELERRFALPVIRVDETLSSYEAESEISAKRKGGHNARARQQHRKTGEIDSRAAAVILQDFFNANGIGAPSFGDNNAGDDNA